MPEKKILVVDDESAIIKVLERFLKKNGFEVVAASDGEKAIEILSGPVAIDCILLDIRMPKVGGVGVARWLREQKRDVPVIVLSGTLGIQVDVAQLRELGYHDIFSKPVDLYALLEFIQKKLVNASK